MTPTWYDVLGVEPDASAEELRAAWRSGIADLDPGDRRFRSLNEAAEVLLDPDRRAAYDATLAPEPVPTAPPVEPVETSAAVAPEPTRPRRTVPTWLLAALAVLVLALAAAVAYLATQPSDDAVAEATSDAQAAAETSVTTILAYGYRTMAEDQEAAGRLMTASYRREFDRLFEVLEQNQPTTKTVVAVEEVVASGIVRSGADRVQVLVFVNRSRTNAETAEPDEFRDQVVVTMERDGDDWLVDGMDTSPLAG